MPLIYVQRYVVSAAPEFIEGGTQYVEGVLSFANPTTIVLSNEVFGQTGNYVLFDYSAAGASFPGGQAELDNNVVIDASGLAFSDFEAITDDPINERIVITLKSNPTNGTQYVEDTLNITGNLIMILNADLYATAGEYILFDAASIAPGSLANITVVPPSGRYVVPGSLIEVSGGLGKQIKVTLA